MSHVTPVSPVTSAGVDATDPAHNAVRVNVVVGPEASLPLATRGPGYTVKLDYDGANHLIYLGLAGAGVSSATAGWTIRKFSYDGNNNLTDVQWANADPDVFQYVWDNRVTYSYS